MFEMLNIYRYSRIFRFLAEVHRFAMFFIVEDLPSELFVCLTEKGSKYIVFQGSARRKKKVVHRTATTDDKKLQSSLKKLAVNSIPGIEEVCMLSCSLFLQCAFLIVAVER